MCFKCVWAPVNKQLSDCCSVCFNLRQFVNLLPRSYTEGGSSRSSVITSFHKHSSENTNSQYQEKQISQILTSPLLLYCCLFSFEKADKCFFLFLPDSFFLLSWQDLTCSQSSCLSLLSSGITDVCQHTEQKGFAFLKCWIPTQVLAQAKSGPDHWATHSLFKY